MGGRVPEAIQVHQAGKPEDAPPSGWSGVAPGRPELHQAGLFLCCSPLVR